jgi:hypothetical protein
MILATGTLVSITEERRPLSPDAPGGQWRVLYAIDMTASSDDLEPLQGWQELRGRRVRLSVSEEVAPGPTTVTIQ